MVGAAVKLQGVGTGGFQGTGTTATFVPGSRLNGLGFNADNLNGTQWINTVTSYGPDPATVPDGATITVLGTGNSTSGGSFTTAGSTANRRPSFDGLYITGGDEGGAGLANQNTINGANSTPVGGTGALSSQGGGVYLFGGANNVQISNDHIDGNSGAYGGGIRVGTAYTANDANGTHAVELGEHQRRHHPRPDHEQRRYEPRRRHRALRRLGELRRSTTTTSAATSRPSTAAASATTAGPTAARSWPTASTSTSRTTRAAA